MPPDGFTPPSLLEHHTGAGMTQPLAEHFISQQSSILNHSQNIIINGGSFHASTSQSAGLDALYQKVAPNAILNSGGRADNPKCHPGTRKEVIGLMDAWMDELGGDRVMWLTGPAGGGKTAIMKTVAEKRREKEGIKTANFFFFREDATRRSSEPVIATILYQLFELYPASSKAIVSALSRRPLLLDGSIAEQCSNLLSILSPIIRTSATSPRLILLIDGLDESDDPGSILRAFETLITEHESPFRLLVASRPEAHIQMAFNELSSPAQTIFLDEKYSPEKDIKHFVTVEFARIKAVHPHRKGLLPDWPLSSDIQEIVEKSSGQFIYAATVMRYLAHAATVPSLSLERVKGIVPLARNSPFKHLDSIYMFILSQVDDPEATRDLLFMTLLENHHNLDRNWKVPIHVLLYHYHSQYTEDVVESCILGLSSIVKPRGYNIEFYHKSLPDFLKDQNRSGEYWIDMDIFSERVIRSLWDKLPDPDDDRYQQSQSNRWVTFCSLQKSIFENLAKSTPEIKQMILNLPLPRWAIFWSAIAPSPECYGKAVVQTIKRLYFEEDVETYKLILERFISSAISVGVVPYTRGIPYAELFCDDADVEDVSGEETDSGFNSDDSDSSDGNDGIYSHSCDSADEDKLLLVDVSTGNTETAPSHSAPTRNKSQTTSNHVGLKRRASSRLEHTIEKPPKLPRAS